MGYKGDDSIDSEHGIVYILNFNHIVVTPRYSALGSSVFHTSSELTSSQGYYDSFLNQQIIGLPTTTGNSTGTVNEQLYNEFGNHLKTYKTIFTKKTFNTMSNNLGNTNYLGSTGITDNNSWSLWKLCQANLFCESDLFGHNSLSSSGWEDSNSRGIFPAFLYDAKLACFDWAPYWTRNIASSKTAIRVNSGTFDTISFNTKHIVRPYFVLA